MEKRYFPSPSFIVQEGTIVAHAELLSDASHCIGTILLKHAGILNLISITPESLETHRREACSELLTYTASDLVAFPRLKHSNEGIEEVLRNELKAVIYALNFTDVVINLQQRKLNIAVTAQSGLIRGNPGKYTLKELNCVSSPGSQNRSSFPISTIERYRYELKRLNTSI
ncbi:MAG: hypothetical protein WCO33_01500 [bacterium]